MSRWIVLFSAIAMISGCQCVGFTECYQDGIDHISECGPNCEWLYFPRLDISRRRCCPNGHSCPEKHCRLFAKSNDVTKANAVDDTSMKAVPNEADAVKTYLAQSDVPSQEIRREASNTQPASGRSTLLDSAVLNQGTTSDGAVASTWIETVELTTFQTTEPEVEVASGPQSTVLSEPSPVVNQAVAATPRVDMNRDTATKQPAARPFPSLKPSAKATAKPLKHHVMHAPLGVKPRPERPVFVR